AMLIKLDPLENHSLIFSENERIIVTNFDINACQALLELYFFRLALDTREPMPTEHPRHAVTARDVSDYKGPMTLGFTSRGDYRSSSSIERHNVIMIMIVDYIAE
ncbi:hypothetical protein FOL47_001368, partial [Perkinsus chesapeaki]